MKSPLALCVALGLACALPVFAAELSFTTAQPQLKTNQVFEVQLHISTPDQEVNAVQATVVYPKDELNLMDVRDANSIITAWIEKPSAALSVPGAYVFSGIIPNGFRGTDGELLTLDFEAKKSGGAAISASDIKILLNDGKGTAASVSSTPLTTSISALKSASSTVSAIADDHTPPQLFTLELSRDPNTFEGKWFISFVAQDKESGVDHYEAREQVIGAATSSWSVATSPYVLQDQSLGSRVEVKAIDKNGNEQLSLLTTPTSTSSARSTSRAGVLSWVVITVCALLAGLILWLKKSKHSK